MKVVALIICMSLALLGGCASSSKIAPYGKDSYIMVVENYWGAESAGDLQFKAVQEGTNYCAKQGKAIKMSNSTKEGYQGWTSTSSTLIFSCVDENVLTPLSVQPPDMKESAGTTCLPNWHKCQCNPDQWRCCTKNQECKCTGTNPPIAYCE